MTRLILLNMLVALALGEFWAAGMLGALACMSAADRGTGDPFGDLLFWVHVKLTRVQLRLRRAERRAQARS